MRSPPKMSMRRTKHVLEKLGITGFQMPASSQKLSELPYFPEAKRKTKASADGDKAMRKQTSLNG